MDGGDDDIPHDVTPQREDSRYRSHTRSASQGESWRHQVSYENKTEDVRLPDDKVPIPPQSILSKNPVGGGVSSSLPGHAQRGHQRTFSHGLSVDGMTAPHHRGHRRVGSKTEFILPDGHSERERERGKPQVTRTSSFPIGHKRNASKTDSIYTIRENKIPMLYRLLFWKKPNEDHSSRIVAANHILLPNTPNPNSIYPPNKIRTAKYTLISFIPKNLFEQFHRIANLYFLFIVMLNFLPSVNAFAKEIAMLPLIFVLSVTACKDLFEDRRRYRSDNKVNNATCRVYDSTENRYVPKAWKSVRVGDIVHLSCNESIPADMVVLNTSESLGSCYIESSNLDGETTLKQRQSVKGIGMDDKFDISKFDSILEISPPSTKINHFLGSIPLQDGSRVSLNETNLILRSCVVKNTDFVEGIVVYAGPESKVMLNNGGSRHKRSSLERCMNTAVMWCVAILLSMCLLSAIGSGLWQSYYGSLKGTSLFIPPQRGGEESLDPSKADVGTPYLSPYYVAFLAFWTYIIIYQVIIPIALYVTVEIVKLLQVYHIHNDPHFVDGDNTVECRATNITEDLGQIQYVFTDKTGTLTENNMVFQRCSINGVDYDHQLVKQTGEDKADTFAVNPKLYHEMHSSYTDECESSRRGVSVEVCSHHQHRVEHFFLTLVLCNTVMVAKTPHKDKMTESGIMPPTSEAEETDSATTTPISFLKSIPPLLRFPPGPERLNLRSLNPFSSRPLSPIEPSPPSSPSTSSKRNLTVAAPTPILEEEEEDCSDIQEFTPDTSSANLPVDSLSSLTSISLNTPKSSRPGPPSTLSLTVKADTPIYEAESPDELALVHAACKYNMNLLLRSSHLVRVDMPGKGVLDYELLHVFPFDSIRKKMSVIVRHPVTRQTILYSKGADSAILSTVDHPVDQLKQLQEFRTLQHLYMYSKKGLRTLCIAMKILRESDYTRWVREFREAESALTDRAYRLSQTYKKIEVNMTLLGATGVEDKLQDGVPETLMALRSAGIVVWLLTGDKQETAINIAHSASLFSQSMRILKLNARTREQTENIIRNLLEKVTEPIESNDNESVLTVGTVSTNTTVNASVSDSRSFNLEEEEDDGKREYGLVVDGKTLVFILDRRTNLMPMFLDLTLHCSSVLISRATPLQKAMVVKLTKKALGVCSLGIGDGANDVSMIQTADVGIGISGVEGRQAVMASDFAISKFKHLQRLLLVHGHLSYYRLASVILYFFYKNANLVFVLLWYQFFSLFSGNNFIDPNYLIQFGLTFTSLPPIILGVYDKDVPPCMLSNDPTLYYVGRTKCLYKKSYFWVHILDAMFQSLVMFFFAYGACSHDDIDLDAFGLTVLHSCLLGQLAHIAIEIRSWTVLHVGIILLSLIIFQLFGVVYTMLCSTCAGITIQYGVWQHLLHSPRHWLIVLLTTVTVIIPRLSYRAFKTALFPTDVQKSVLQHKYNKKMKRSKRGASVESSDVDSNFDNLPMNSLNVQNSSPGVSHSHSTSNRL